MKKHHHPKLLQSMLGNFSYSLVLLSVMVNKANNSREFCVSIKHGPEFNEIVITILGLTLLLSVCDITANQYNEKQLKNQMKSIKAEFDYKNIRDILTHWDEYSLCRGRLQKNKNDRKWRIQNS